MYNLVCKNGCKYLYSGLYAENRIVMRVMGITSCDECNTTGRLYFVNILPERNMTVTRYLCEACMIKLFGKGIEVRLLYE